jgi:hypothetical protein
VISTFQKTYEYFDKYSDKIVNKESSIHELYFGHSNEELDRFFKLLCHFTNTNERCVFRGHKNEDNGEKWKLETTWYRAKRKNPTSEELFTILNQISNQLPNEISENPNNIEMLMLAQHHREELKINTPLLDFTYDFLVALHFALDEVTTSKYYATINILSLSYLCSAYTNFLAEKNDFTSTLDLINHQRTKAMRCLDPIGEYDYTDIEAENVREYFNMRLKKKTFEIDAFPENELLIIPNSPKENSRMNNQKGVFIYDMLQHGDSSEYGKDLEDFIQILRTYSNDPILIKAHISKQHTGAIKTLLEQSNINKATLGLS